MKWEYQVLQASGTKDETDWLNKQGAQGWELIYILVYGDYPSAAPQFDYYFKRKIEINEKLRKIQLKEEPNNDDKNGSG
jgi:hypothetical protein